MMTLHLRKTTTNIVIVFSRPGQSPSSFSFRRAFLQLQAKISQNLCEIQAAILFVMLSYAFYGQIVPLCHAVLSWKRRNSNSKLQYLFKWLNQTIGDHSKIKNPYAKFQN